LINYICNLSRPEQGGVGRYAYEIVRRAKGVLDYTFIDSSHLFGDTLPRKIYFTIAERKKFLRKHADAFNDLNHFLQVEMFYRIGRGRNIVTFHNPPPFTIHNHLEQIKNDVMSLSTSVYFYRRYSDAIKHSDFIIANSEFTKEGILETGFDKNKIRVTFGGVSENHHVINKLRERDDVIGYVGSFAFHKRIGRLLKEREMDRGPLMKYRFELYGRKGVQLKRLRSKYDNKNKVHFRGKVPETQLVHTLNSFKALVMPSMWETFGLPIIEGVACGTPVFVYDDSEITPEVKKYAIEISNASEIPAILETIDDKKLEEMSIKVKEEFNWDKHFETLLRIYEEM